MRTMRTIRTMNTTARFSLIGMHKICTALNKEKSVAAFRNRVTMLTMRTMISLHPISFKISVPKCIHHSRTPLLKPLCRFVSLFQSNRKSTRLRAFGAKIENFRENAFPTVIYLANAQNLRRIIQRKGLCFIQAISTNENDQDDEYDSEFFFDQDAQNLQHINQRKGQCFTQASSTDEDDKDDEYDSGFFYLSFPIRDAQNLCRIKQRNGLYLIHE